VTCSIGMESAAVNQAVPPEPVLLEMGGSTFKWHRVELANKCVSKGIDRLWFDDSGVLIYYGEHDIVYIAA